MTPSLAVYVLMKHSELQGRKTQHPNIHSHLLERSLSLEAQMREYFSLILKETKIIEGGLYNLFKRAAMHDGLPSKLVSA